jgi:bacterial/archaeal transporter family-2 protein
MLHLGQPIAFLAAIIGGLALPLQAGINAHLARLLPHPLTAALVSCTISVMSLGPMMLAFRAPPPNLETLAAAPIWVFIGGILGATYLIVAILSAPALGAATFIAVAVAAQMAASVALDHFALIGFAERPATPGRLIGMVLVVGGVLLVQFSGAPKSP